MCLSVVVPIYNESPTLETVVDRLLNVQHVKQIILVNDGSDQATTQIINELSQHVQIQVIHHESNRGKGAALRSGFEMCECDIVVAQDADLEYDPNDLPYLIQPILDGKADAVFGTRFSNGRRVASTYLHFLANRILTAYSNITTGLTITDMETCYKAIKRSEIQGLELSEDRFGIEPELTAKLANKGCRIMELPISYKPRSYTTGKKIGLSDGIRALWCITKYGFLTKECR